MTLSARVAGCDPADASGGPEAAPSVRSGVVHERPLERPAELSRQQQLELAELLRRHYASVFRTLRRLGVEESRADDAAQEVFIVASRKLEHIESGRERNYLLSSALRVAANYRRASRTRREVLDEDALERQRDPGPSAEQLVDRKRLRTVLDDVLSGLPSEMRTVFVLFEIEGLNIPEISEITETKAGTVASRLRRARELFLIAVKRLRARGVLEGAGA